MKTLSRFAAVCLLFLSGAPAVFAAATAVRVGRLLDVDAQKVRENVVLVVEDGKFQALGTSVPAGAEVLDLSGIHGDRPA